MNDGEQVFGTPTDRVVLNALRTQALDGSHEGEAPDTERAIEIELRQLPETE